MDLIDSHAAAHVEPPRSDEVSKFRAAYADAGYRQFEPSRGNDAAAEDWVLAHKAAAQLGPKLDLSDAKAVAADVRDASLHSMMLQPGEKPKEPSKLRTATPDVLARYYFSRHAHNRSAMITEEQAARLGQLDYDGLIRGMQWHTVTPWVRALWIWDPLSNIGFDVYVLEWIRRGLDGTYWVVQDLLRKAK